MMESAGYPHNEVAALEQLNTADRAYLAAMAEAVTQEHTDYTAPAPTSPAGRRKRGALDSSPAESRRAKRNAPSAAMSSHPDVDAAASYVESAVEAAQAAAAASVNAADFTALQQATVDHHESADPANASSTAAAALGSMYPTLHVPPTTEETFAAQIANENEHQPFGSNDMMPADGLPGSGNTGPLQAPLPPGQNGIRTDAPVFPGRPSEGPRPAVGSEEWHKQRKDNHKEGGSSARRLHALSPGATFANSYFQSSVGEEKQSMKESTSWPRSFLVAKRIKVPFYNAPCPSSHNSKRTRHRTSRSGRLKSFSRSRPFKSLVPQTTSSNRSVRERIEKWQHGSHSPQVMASKSLSLKKSPAPHDGIFGLFYRLVSLYASS